VEEGNDHRNNQPKVRLGGFGSLVVIVLLVVMAAIAAAGFSATGDWRWLAAVAPIALTALVVWIYRSSIHFLD